MKSSVRFLIFAAALVFVAVVLFLIQSKHFVLTDVVLQEPAPQSTPEPEFGGFTPPPAPTPEEVKSAAALTPEFDNPNGGPPIMPALPLQKGELPWEAQIRTIMTAPGLTDAEKARRLFSLMPGIAPEGRETATEDAIKLVTNADYAVAKPVLFNPTTFGPALSVLFADLSDRPPELALPTMLELAKSPQHPFAPYARENLQVQLGADYGTDWERWDAAIRGALAKKQ